MASSSPQPHAATFYSSPDFVILDTAALYMLTIEQNLDTPFKDNTSYHNTLTVSLTDPQGSIPWLPYDIATSPPTHYHWEAGSEDTLKLHTQTTTFLEALHHLLVVYN